MVTAALSGVCLTGNCSPGSVCFSIYIRCYPLFAVFTAVINLVATRHGMCQRVHHPIGPSVADQYATRHLQHLSIKIKKEINTRILSQWITQNSYKCVSP